MAYDLYSLPTADNDQKQVAWLMLLFNQARTRRLNYEVQWEEAAAICWPEYRNTFAFGHYRAPGVKYTEFQLDSTGAIASHRFMAICDAMITPFTQNWSYVKPSNKDLLKDRSIALYYQKLNETLWYHRYRPDANFFSQNQLNWQALGVFGNMGMMIDELDTQKGHYKPGLRYMATSPGEMYKLRNHQKRVDGFIRHFRWNARQAYQRWGDKIPPILRKALEIENMELWDFLQFCVPNTEYDPAAIFDWRGKPYASIYVSVAGYCILERGGYRSLPWSAGGYICAPEEEYERGPAQMVLPALKTLNSEKGMFLRQGHKAAEPAWLIAEDAITSLKTEPNAFNFGGLSSAGAELVRPLASGQIQITEEMMAQEQKFVDDAFLVSLWNLFNTQEKPSAQRSMADIMSEAAERGIFLGPTLGKQYTDYVPTMIDRELELLSSMRLLPKPPPALKEAKKDYQIVYCAPLAQALEAQKVSGFMRTLDSAGQAVRMTGNQALMDIFDLDEAFYDIGTEHNFVPVSWMRSPQAVANQRQTRQQAQERENQVKELPGRAAIIKAQAITAKAQAGQNIGGTLSGTAEGGMPMMPGQAAPGGRAFGQPGP